MLDDALERTRAIFRLVTQIGDRVESGVGDREVDSLFREKRLQLFRLNLDDLTNLILFQRMENDRFVDTIEEFGEELFAVPWFDVISRMTWLPRFDVMTMIVFVKSTVCP